MAVVTYLLPKCSKRTSPARARCVRITCPISSARTPSTLSVTAPSVPSACSKEMAMTETIGPESAVTAPPEELAAFVDQIDHVSDFWNDHGDEVGHYMREHCPVKHSSAHGGFWVLARYDDILRAAKDHETFSVAAGKLVPGEDPEKRSRVRP